MIGWISWLLLFGACWRNGHGVDLDDMNIENVRVLRREQGGGIVAATKAWTCEGVQLEMARYGHTVVDCLVHNGNMWFRIDAAMTWQESWQACHAMAGGNLASVHTASDYATLRALYWFDQWKTAGNWIGLNKIVKESDSPGDSDEYQWSDGTKFEYRKWMPKIQSPDNVNVGNCVFFGTVIGQAATVNGSNVRKYYSWLDGFGSDVCNQLKMPICKVANSNLNRS